MPTYAFKYYILMLFLGCSGMLMKSFSSTCHLLANLQRMLVIATVRGKKKRKEKGTLTTPTFLSHKMQML